MTAAHSDWRSQAACTSHDPELFFPIGSTGPALRQLEQARQVCRSCPPGCPAWSGQSTSASMTASGVGSVKPNARACDGDAAPAGWARPTC